MMLHAICIVHLLSNTPLAESWLKIRHKDRRGLLEHLSHDAQSCKSTYAFWHERSRNRRCYFIQNPPLIIVCFWVASAYGIRDSCRRKDGSNPSLPLSGTGFIPVTGWSYWKTGGRRLECRLEVFTLLLQHKRVIAVRIRNRPFCWYSKPCKW